MLVDLPKGEIMTRSCYILSIGLTLLFLTAAASMVQSSVETDCGIVSSGEHILPYVECEALLDLYNNTDGANWTNKTGWNQNNDPCNWYGVACSAGTSGYVTAINLSHNSLSGPLPTRIGSFSYMTYLNLAGNSLNGNLPFTLGNLSRLEILYLQANRLTGTIPTELGSLSSLNILHLGANSLTGAIPTELGNLGRTDVCILLRGPRRPWQRSEGPGWS
jgi:hypothetical protein